MAIAFVILVLNQNKSMSKENIKLKVNPNQRKKLTFRVTPEGAQLLKNGQMPLTALAGLLGGIGGVKGVEYANDRFAERDDSSGSDDIEDADIEEDSNDLCEYEVPTSVEFSESVTDEMSFNQAFQTAREELGQGGFFTWRGQHYNTYNKEEWDSFSEEDKKEFFKMFQENTDFENGKDNTHEDTIVPDHGGSEPDPNRNQEKEQEGDEGNESSEIEEVTLEEIGSDEEIIEGLNDGEAYTEEDNYGEDIT